MGNGRRAESVCGKGKRAPVKYAVGLALWTILVLVITDAAVSRTAAWFWQPWIGPLARQNVKLYCALSGPGAGDVVLIGDSRVRHDLAAGVLEEELSRERPVKVMNLGLDAAQLIAMREIVDRVMALPHPPRLVVIGVSAFTVNAHNPRLSRDLRLYARPGMMARGLLLCPDLSQKVGALEGLTHGLEAIFQLVALPQARGMCAFTAASRGSAYQYPLTAEAKAHNEKAVAYKTETARRRAFAKEAAEYRDRLMQDFEISSEGDRLFQELLRAVRSRGAQAVILIMPEAVEFEKATEVPGRAQARDYFLKTAASFGATLVDLNDAEYRPAPEDFFDYATHLKPDPAIALSRKLATKVILPLKW